MTISLIFAWIATLGALFTSVKILVKKNKKANIFFHKIHIPVGIVLIAAGIIHGLLAGNVLGTSIKDASIGKQLFTLNLGTISLIISILLGLTYVFRKTLKGKWMICHRVLTLMLVVTVAIHIFQVGINLPKVFAINKTDVEDTALVNDEVTSGALKGDEDSDAVSEKNGVSSISAGENGNLLNFSGASLIDGTYEGSAEGFNGEITVSVTVENGTVTDIEVLSENDTPDFFERATDIISDIRESQSLEVDAVSGATYSSRGIRDAVYNALQDAVESGELKISEIQASKKHGGHGRK